MSCEASAGPGQHRLFCRQEFSRRAFNHKGQSAEVNGVIPLGQLCVFAKGSFEKSVLQCYNVLLRYNTSAHDGTHPSVLVVPYCPAQVI